MHDPLDLLMPTGGEIDLHLRHRILADSLAEMRRQRRNQRRRAYTSLVATLGAAVLLFLVIPPASPPDRPRPGRLFPDEPVSAIRLEWRALDEPGAAKSLYQQAGARYVDEGDFAGAVRTYGASLDAGTTDDLQTSTDDDWLLMAIKLARKKESEP